MEWGPGTDLRSSQHLLRVGCPHPWPATPLQPPSVEELEYYGITAEFQEFIRTLNYSTFRWGGGACCAGRSGAGSGSFFAACLCRPCSEACLRMRTKCARLLPRPPAGTSQPSTWCRCRRGRRQHQTRRRCSTPGRRNTPSLCARWSRRWTSCASCSAPGGCASGQAALVLLLKKPASAGWSLVSICSGWSLVSISSSVWG